MAKQLGNNYVEREDGDLCPRGSSNLLEKGEAPCTGILYREMNHAAREDLMRCKVCDYTWAVKFRVGESVADQKGKAPRFRLIPEELVEALARAEFERREEQHELDPRKRKTWASLVAEKTTRMDQARGVLARCWPEFGEWFQDAFGVEDPDSERTRTARLAIQEIAIPTLERYEERFDTPDKPRIALQSILDAR